MTVWTIKKNGVWEIYADGKYVTAADNEDDAKYAIPPSMLPYERQAKKQKKITD